MEFVCFSFHVGLLFFINFVFQTRHWKYCKFWHCINQMRQLWRCSVKNTKFWSLYECKGYNSRQFITELLNKGWTENSINSLEQLTGVRATADAVRVLMKTSTRLSRCWVRKTNLRATKQSEKFHMKRGDPSIISFADYSLRSPSQMLQGKVHLTAELKHTTCTSYFWYAVWETITW